MNTYVRKEVSDLIDEIKENRRYIHQYPELGLETKNTRVFIVDRLKSYGYDEIEEGYAKNGVVACLRVNDNSHFIAYRADIDALPMQEVSDVAYKSCNKNAHMCGHDGHTAALLAFAHYAINHKDEIKENILFIFQPGEEGPGGAKLMIEEGLFKKYPSKAIIGTHVKVDVKKGFIGSRVGPMMGRNSIVYIDIKGLAAHGAMPNNGHDALLAAAAFITQCQSIVSRFNDPLKNGVLTLGTINGGETSNVICDNIHIEGTMRSFDDDTYEQMKKDLQRIAEAIGLIYSCECKVIVEDYYQVVNNNEHLVSCLKNVSKDIYVEAKQTMAAEDFSFYQKEVPGVFFYSGIYDDVYTKDVHDASFNFDETALLTTVETYIRMIELGERLYKEE